MLYSTFHLLHVTSFAMVCSDIWRKIINLLKSLNVLYEDLDIFIFTIIYLIFWPDLGNVIIPVWSYFRRFFFLFCGFSQLPKEFYYQQRYEKIMCKLLICQIFLLWIPDKKRYLFFFTKLSVPKSDHFKYSLTLNC